MIVAIDGPAGAGKSTVARMLAARLGFRVLDSGALYRAAAWKVGPDLAHAAGILAGTRIELDDSNDASRVLVDGKDVTSALRSSEISERSSRIAESPEARAALIPIQRAHATRGNYVVEGRDIGTVVFPDAIAKFYLDATLDERAHRRWMELSQRGEAVKLETVRGDIAQRDERDRTRAVAPLRKANDAIVVDSTSLPVEQVMERIAEELRRRGVAVPEKSASHIDPEVLYNKPAGPPPYFRMSVGEVIFYHFCRALLWPLVRIYFRGRCIGRKNIPQKGPVIVATNHAAALDPVLIGFFLYPRVFRFMAKVELFKNPFLRLLIGMLGAFPVRRGQRDTEALRTALWILRATSENRVLLLFPEGTRTRTGQMGTARSGIGRLVHWSQAPVLPCFIRGTFALQPPGTHWPHPGRVTLHVGQPMEFAEERALPGSKETFQAIADAVLDAIAALDPDRASDRPGGALETNSRAAYTNAEVSS